VGQKIERLIGQRFPLHKLAPEKVGPPDAVNTGGPVPSIKMLAGSAASRPARAARWTLAIRLGSAMRTRF
jgi:hypothetical protein